MTTLITAAKETSGRRARSSSAREDWSDACALFELACRDMCIPVVHVYLLGILKGTGGYIYKTRQPYWKGIQCVGKNGKLILTAMGRDMERSEIKKKTNS